MRDIAGARLRSSSGAARGGLTEVAIADPRNDDNAVIPDDHSVPTSCTDHFGHAAASRKKEVADSWLERSMDRFFCARGAVTLIYRRSSATIFSRDPS